MSRLQRVEPVAGKAKMWPMRLAIFLLATALFAYHYPAAFAETPPSRVPSRTPDVATFLTQPNRPVFYIRIFGNDFPVPVRFELMPESRYPIGVEAQLKSPSGELILEQPKDAPGEPAPLESINVGSYKKLDINRHWLKRNYDVEKTRCYGLSVETWTAKVGLAAKVHQVTVLIHDNENYIQFIGRSDDLAKQLLRLYGAINGEVIGNQCRWSGS